MSETISSQFEQEKEQFKTQLDSLREEFVHGEAKLDQVDGAIAKLVQKFGVEYLEVLLKLKDSRWGLVQRSSSAGYGYGGADRTKDQNKIEKINKFFGVDESLDVVE